MTEITEPLNLSRSGTWRQVNKLLGLTGLRGGGDSAFHRVDGSLLRVVQRVEFMYGT